MGVEVSVRSGGSTPPPAPLVILITYAELQAGILANSLVAGQRYVISDYQTIYDQPDYDIEGAPKIVVSTLSGSVEPLLITAISANTISPLASG